MRRFPGVRPCRKGPDVHRGFEPVLLQQIQGARVDGRHQGGEGPLTFWFSTLR